MNSRCGLRVCRTASEFKINSTLWMFLVDSAVFFRGARCALLGFIINLLNAKCSSVTHSAAIFKPSGRERERGISTRPGRRQKSRFVGRLISPVCLRGQKEAQLGRYRVWGIKNKAHGNWTCLFPWGEISSGQVDKVLIYDGDDGERKIYRRRKQAGCWTVKTTVVKNLIKKLQQVRFVNRHKR